jgi:hypothetical protein
MQIKSLGLLVLLILSGCANRAYQAETPADLQFQAQQAQAVLNQDCYNHQTEFSTKGAANAAATQNAMCSLAKLLATRKLRQLYGSGLVTTVEPSVAVQTAPKPTRTVCRAIMSQPAIVPCVAGNSYCPPPQPPQVVGQECVTE